MTHRRLGVAAAAATLAAVVVAVIASRHAQLADVSPVVPGGGWRSAWVVAVTAAVVASAAGWLLARRGHVRLRVAVAAAVLVQIVPLAGPLLLSKDVYLYWAVGRIVAVHHGNPYVRTLDDYRNDPSFPFPSQSWRPYPAAYGPAGEAYVTVPAVVGGTSAHRAELAYRVAAVLGILATVALLAWRTRSAAAVALLGWSPLVALHYGGGGHSDAWMMLFLVLGVALRPSARSGAAWAIAGSFKPVPVILLPLELVRARFQLPRRWWAAVIGATVSITAASTVVWGTRWLTAQARGIHRGAGYPTPLGGVHWLTQLGLAHSDAVVLAGAVFVIVYVLLAVRAWRTGRAGLSLAASALVLTSTLIGPWYGLWPLALASIEGEATAGGIALALAAYLLLADAVQY